MTLDEYQEAIRKFASDSQTTRDAVLMCAVGLSGEVGEVNELIKKSEFHRKPFERVDLMLELGDVLWYLSTMARLNGLSMNDIAEANIVKLEERQSKKGKPVC